jgi:GntR family transcriptional regulator/MocR family aminotransferase
MHLVGWLPPGIDDRQVALAASAAGLETTALSLHYLDKPPQRGGLLLGFSAFDAAQQESGIIRLAGILRSAVATAAA